MLALSASRPSHFAVMWWLAYVVAAVVASLSVASELEAIIVRVPLLAWAAARAVRGGRAAWLLLMWLHGGEAFIVGTYGVVGFFLVDQGNPGLLVLSDLAIIGLLLLPQVRSRLRPSGVPATPATWHPGAQRPGPLKGLYLGGIGGRWRTRTRTRTRTRIRARALTVGLTALPALLYLLLTLRDLSEGRSAGAALITLAFGGMFFGLAVGVWRGGLFSHYFMAIVGVLVLFNHGPWWLRAAAFTYGTAVLLCLFVSWPRSEEAAARMETIG